MVCYSQTSSRFTCFPVPNSNHWSRCRTDYWGRFPKLQRRLGRAMEAIEVYNGGQPNRVVVDFNVYIRELSGPEASNKRTSQPLAYTFNPDD